MAENTSPALARRELRFALRKGREAIGFTQGQVADALEWSISKVNRIETGDVKISNGDLKELLALLRITDRGRVEELSEWGRASRRRGWWDEPGFRQHLTLGTRQLFELESVAAGIRCYQPTNIPGVLQTATYAAEILSYWARDLEPEVRQAKVASRLQRHQHVFDRPNSPLYLLILDESVVLRVVGGPVVMAEQLQHTLDLAAAGRIHLRIVPLPDGIPYATTGTFTLFALEGDHDALLYRESGTEDSVAGSPELVASYRAVFEQAWQRALPEEASGRLLRAQIASLLASGDRVTPMLTPTRPG